MLIYTTVLAHVFAWEEMINYNKIDFNHTGIIGHKNKNITDKY